MYVIRPLSYIVVFLSVFTHGIHFPPPTNAERATGRRRKKSCVPRSETPRICEECYARGVQCQTQEVSLGTKRRHPGGGNPDLQQRVAELEEALLSLTQQLGSTPRTVEPDSSAAKALQQLRVDSLPFTPVTSPETDAEVPLKHAPILSLFDNAILGARLDDGVRESSDGAILIGSETINNTKSKLLNIRRRLLALFPSQQWQNRVLSNSYLWWACWVEVYPQIFGVGVNFSAVQFVADLRSSDSVQKIAKGLLCLVAILQENPQEDNTSGGLMSRFSEIMHTIDELVLGDDELAGTVDGVECFILRAKYELNCGRIRKSWLTQRRAISLAELAGIPKRPANPMTDMSQSIRRESLWKFLYLSDRYLSLLLGLPYGPTEIHSDWGNNGGAYAQGTNNLDFKEHYASRLASIMGHIIDRNQQLPSNNMLPLTFKIEGELTELAASMADDWWKTDFELGPTGKQIYCQLLPQFWHHQARAFLHLPFMLKATTDRRFEYNKTATLESARAMIACYRVVRPALGFGSLICKMVDFLAFTGAMILVLNLLDHHGKSDVSDHSETDRDQELILITTSLLQRASVETNGLVVTQAAKALEMFSDIKGLFSPLRKMESPCTAKIVIPFFGTVVFGPGTSFSNSKKEQHLQQPSQQKQQPEAMLLPPRQMPTPSDQSQDCATPPEETMLASNINTLMEPVMPFDFGSGENAKELGANGDDVLADVNFDLDQEWSWFWNNIDIPSMEWQGTVT